MDSTEASPLAPQEGNVEQKSASASRPLGGGGSQSQLPRILLWMAAVALAFRVFTALTDRGQRGEPAGLVSWQRLEAAAASGRMTGKPLLYDFTAAWCAPCRRLDLEGWGDSGIARTVNEDFLPARVVDRQTEDGRNSPVVSELQRRYSIRAFPTLIVADASGREIARLEGYSGKEQLVEFLREARKKAGK